MSDGSIDRGKLFDMLYQKSLEADDDCGGLVGYNFLSGEPMVGISAGIPMLARCSDGKLTLANFMRMHIYSALGTLSMGCEILSHENVKVDTVCGHGGFFKAETVAQKAMSAALGSPVTVMKNASEGGAWGIAVLALFMASEKKTLEELLEQIFEKTERTVVSADEKEKEAFETFMKKYRAGLKIEKIASEVLYNA